MSPPNTETRDTPGTWYDGVGLVRSQNAISGHNLLWNIYLGRYRTLYIYIQVCT